MYHSAEEAAAPSAIAMSALMLHVSTPAALQSIWPLLPEAPELHSPDALPTVPDSPVHELPSKAVAVQPLDWLQEEN